jgi:hypothetical protein
MQGSSCSSTSHLRRDLFQALRVHPPAAVMRDLGGLLGRPWQPTARTRPTLSQRKRPTRCARLAQHAAGEPRSLTQGDPAPSNVLFRDGQAALLTDFEYAAVRPALFDLAQWYVRCPLPSAWFDLLADTLAAALGTAGVYRRNRDFHRDLARQASYAALYMLTWLPIEQALTDDVPWVGDWRVRQALLSSARRGADAAAMVADLQPLAHWFGALQLALARAWPDSGNGALDWRSLVGKTG